MIFVKLVCHVAYNAEDDEAGEHVCYTVHDGNYNGVPGIQRCNMTQENNEIIKKYNSS